MALNVEEMAVRLWGPVKEERALQLGALAASSSVLMKPLATDDTVIERVRALFPQEVFPTATDSKASLCARLKESSFIQAKTVLKHGNGKGGYVQLNSTCYPQPRRVQWSAVTVPEHVDEDKMPPQRHRCRRAASATSELSCSRCQGHRRCDDRVS